MLLNTSNSTKGSPSREANISWGSMLWNPTIYYLAHRSPPLVPVMSKINPVHALPFYCNILIIFPINVWIFQMVAILYIFQPMLCMHLSSTPSCLVLPLSSPSLSDRQNAICWRIQCMKHLIMQYYPAICFFNLNKISSSAPFSRPPSVYFFC